MISIDSIWTKKFGHCMPFDPPLHETSNNKIRPKHNEKHLGLHWECLEIHFDSIIDHELESYHSCYGCDELDAQNDQLETPTLIVIVSIFCRAVFLFGLTCHFSQCVINMWLMLNLQYGFKEASLVHILVLKKRVFYA